MGQLDKHRLLKWLKLKKMNTDTDSISSNIPTNADDVNFTPRAQQNMNTVSEMTVLAEDNSGIPCHSSIIVSLPTVSSCFNETSISSTCNKPTTVNSYSSDRATRIQKGTRNSQKVAATASFLHPQSETNLNDALP